MQIISPTAKLTAEPANVPLRDHSLVTGLPGSLKLAVLGPSRTVAILVPFDGLQI
ncbi:MAG: hypothetical protein WAM14_13260 [Candidatus Nitrosopolaris sp.]